MQYSTHKYGTIFRLKRKKTGIPVKTSSTASLFLFEFDQYMQYAYEIDLMTKKPYGIVVTFN